LASIGKTVTGKMYTMSKRSAVLLLLLMMMLMMTMNICRCTATDNNGKYVHWVN